MNRGNEMNYLIAIAICIFSSFVLFLVLKEEKKICIGLIVGIWILFLTYLGLKYFIAIPKINIVGEKNLVIDVGETYTEKGATASYRFSDISDQIKITSNLNTEKVGVYEIIYEVIVDGKKSSEKRSIKIIDSVPPEINLSGNDEIIVSSMELYKEEGFTAKDNYDGDIEEKVETNVVQIEENKYKKTYTVKDSSGNKSEAIRTIEIKDIVPPVIKLKGNEVENMYIGGEYEESGATATDDLDGDLTNKIVVTKNIDTNKIGSYTVLYTVKDSSGNVGETKRRVEVVQRPVEGGIVYLTFDDGPSSSITPHILDILKEEKVKATFFILNYDEGNEYLVKRIVNEGHTIAIHGYSHDYGYIYKSEKIYMENLSKLREKIKQSTGVDTIITRFPGGSSNTVSKYNPGIMTRLTHKVIEEGYRYFDWNVSSGDAGGARNSQDVYNNVVNGIKHNRSNVVLMHDFSGNNKTLDALRNIIHYIKNNGYAISNITPETPMITHSVAN